MEDTTSSRNSETLKEEWLNFDGHFFVGSPIGNSSREVVESRDYKEEQSAELCRALKVDGG